MADNFNLRQFLSENKLTKNAKLLKEELDTRSTNDESIDLWIPGASDSEDPAGDAQFIQDSLAKKGIESKVTYSIDEWYVELANKDQIEQAGDALHAIGYDYNKTEMWEGVGEEEAPQGADISGYWVLYSGMNAPRFLQFIKMFPSEQEAQEALENAPTTYGSHVLRDNWGIMSAQEWLEDGYELDSSRQGHPDYKSPKRLTPDERRAADAEFNRIRQDFYEQKQTTNKMTSREKYLTRIVENALGLQVTEDDNVDYTMGNQDDPNQLPNPASQISIPEGEEMVQKEPLPKYENIEKLMKEIEEGTNKAMYEYKMKRMMEIAEMLEAKVSSLEEGEHAEYTDKKAINQMRKDIAALRKGEEKLRKEFDKKFNKKEKGAAPKKEAEAEKPTLQEGTFDLRKFLVENKITANSKLTQE